MKDCVNESWNMTSHTRLFLSAEKSYKEAYRKLVLPYIQHQDTESLDNEDNSNVFLHDDSERQRYSEQIAGWLMHSVDEGYNYQLFVGRSRKLMAIIKTKVKEKQSLNIKNS